MLDVTKTISFGSVSNQTQMKSTQSSATQTKWSGFAASSQVSHRSGCSATADERGQVFFVHDSVAGVMAEVIFAAAARTQNRLVQRLQALESTRSDAAAAVMDSAGESATPGEPLMDESVPTLTDMVRRQS